MTMEDDNSFWLLAKNLKKRSFKARSDKKFFEYPGIYLSCAPPPCLSSAFVKNSPYCMVSFLQYGAKIAKQRGGAQEKNYPRI